MTWKHSKAPVEALSFFVMWDGVFVDVHTWFGGPDLGVVHYAIAGAVRAIGVDSAAAKSRGKL